jgi:hypothetical protein
MRDGVIVAEGSHLELLEVADYRTLVQAYEAQDVSV